MIGDLISGGLKLIGGLMGQDAADADRASRERMAAQNIAMQREFAQQGIRWKVEDARAAGVHPLYALGASSHSFAPVSIGGSSGSPMGAALASMGQDVGRAVNAASTPTERVSMYAEQAAKLQLDNMALQNQLLASKLATTNQAGGNPPLPESGGLPAIPQDPKQDPRPPIQIGGNQVSTDPGTTNMQKIEDRYGDESPVSHVLSLGVAYHDLVRNYGQPATWPKQIIAEAWNRLSQEARDEYGNFQRFVSRLRRSGSAQGGGGW